MRIGFVGAGMMAEALIGGVLAAGIAARESVMASDVSGERRAEVERRHGIRTSADNTEVVRFADVVVLAVKPQHALSALQSIGREVAKEKLILSIMAGVPTRAIEERLPEGVPVIRVMPNILCVVKEAASAVAKGVHATDEHLATALRIFSSVGVAVSVDESLMDAVTGLSGSGPAYVFTVIEALSDGGVAAGLPRPIALKLAAQTVLGAAKMVLEGDDHPAVLRERVTSPAGTTVEGLAVLESKGVRDAFAQAVRAAALRSKRLGEGS